MEKVSVLLTTYNDGPGIRRVLDFIDRQAGRFQDLVIVSDACHDQTDAIIQKWLVSPHNGYFLKSFVRRKDRAGRADAIRYGLKCTRHDLTVIFAGDIQPFQDAFINLLRYFEEDKVGAVTGHPVLLNGWATPADYLAHLMWSSHDNIGRAQTARGLFFHLNGEMFALRKSALKGFKDYDGIAEDAMLGALIRRSGWKVLWAGDVQYFMRYPHSMKEWLRVRKRCCYSRIDLWKQCGLQDYPFYEVSHPEYLVNILKCVQPSIKGVLALGLGVALETLIRVYYMCSFAKHQHLLDTLWQPAGETKW